MSGTLIAVAIDSEPAWDSRAVAGVSARIVVTSGEDGAVEVVRVGDRSVFLLGHRPEDCMARSRKPQSSDRGFLCLYPSPKLTLGRDQSVGGGFAHHVGQHLGVGLEGERGAMDDSKPFPDLTDALDQMLLVGVLNKVGHLL